MRKLPRHPQRQRTPAAAEFEDRLPVGEVGMLDALAQRWRQRVGRQPLPAEGGRLGRDDVVIRAGRLALNL
jgi:hypothetical protein